MNDNRPSDRSRRFPKPRDPVRDPVVLCAQMVKSLIPAALFIFAVMASIAGILALVG